MRWAYARQCGLPCLRVACLLVTVSAVGCIHGDLPAERFRYVNDSTETLFVEVNHRGYVERFPPPGESQRRLYRKDYIGSGPDPLRIDVYDTRGCTAMVFETTVGDFDTSYDNTLTIGDADLYPQAERTTCDVTVIPTADIEAPVGS